MISCSSEQPPIALGVWSSGKAIGYPSQYPTDLTRCVHGSGEVRVQVLFEERVLSAFLLPAQPALKLAGDHVTGNSFFPLRPVLLEFLPSSRSHLVT